MNLLIDFDAIARNPANALRRVTNLLARAGLNVIDVASDGKLKRLAGISFREVELTFADSQKLGLRIKATGDVYEVRVNGKVTPVRDQDDAAAAVTELARLIDAGRERFQKRLAAMRMKPPEGIRTAVPRQRDVLIKQIAEVDAAIEGAKQELAELQAA